MKTKFTFYPFLVTHNSNGLPRNLFVDDIKNETMLFSADKSFAQYNGGPITKRVLESLEKIPSYQESFENWSTPVIDTRVHMLMEGQYPAICGWHGDAVPRHSNGQPDLSKMDGRVKHFLVTISTEPNGVSNTLFLDEPVKVKYDPKRVWGSVNEELSKKKKLSFVETSDGVVYEFKQRSLHAASPAKTRGWRYFF